MFRRKYRKGSPKFVIPVNQLVGLRSLKFSWKAKMLGVSETTLRRVCEYSLPIGEDTYTTISVRSWVTQSRVS